MFSRLDCINETLNCFIQSDNDTDMLQSVFADVANSAALSRLTAYCILYGVLVISKQHS